MEDGNDAILICQGPLIPWLIPLKQGTTQKLKISKFTAFDKPIVYIGAIAPTPTKSESGALLLSCHFDCHFDQFCKNLIKIQKN